MRKFILLAVLVLVAMSLVPAALLAQDAPTVTVVTCWGGAEGVGFNGVNAAFTEATGIEVEHIDDRDCHLLPQIMASAGNPPDISAMPRPGVMAQMAREGLIIPLTSGDDPVMTMEYVAENYGQALIDLGSVDGELYGIVSAVSSKSTAWRRTDVFEDIGEDAPTTWDEFIEYLDILAEEGIPSLSLGALDGWTLTDFFENLYLNIAGPEMYHKLFVTHEVEWTDPTVISALEHFAQAVSPTDSRLAGGSDGALATGFIDAIDKFMAGEAGIYPLASFVRSFAEANFPGQTCPDDFGFFQFPTINEMYANSVVLGGNFFIMFNDRPEVREWMNWIAGAEAQELIATQETGPQLSANYNVSADVYAEPCDGAAAAMVANANHVAFDGSDLAPGAIGGDAMFTGLQDLVANPDSVAEVAQFIEDVADTAYDM
ncbi:MAG: ABC transporter substrate-binding protein [Chloroflexi bacterium]|nr:ABC transporter substrate-binding protein [Chloroflexota bacterium]